MLKKGDRVLVCVSGGPDSIFLLNALDHLKKELGLTLVVANLDHGVRGTLSRKDSDFVRGICSDLGLICFHKRLKPGRRINKKLSREENLREARYNFFKDAAAELGANVMATGHTLDDNAETILMRIIRGSSAKGLAGIPPVRSNRSQKLIRPLIEIEKQEVLDFLKKEDIDYRIDHTNKDEAFLRNRIRKKLFPCLASYNPNVKFALINMAESLREDLEFMEEQRRLKKEIIKGRKPIYINLKDLVVQPRALQREIIKDALERSGANIKKLTYRHWKEVSNLLRFKRKGKALDMPGDIRIVREESRVVFKRRNYKTR